MSQEELEKKIEAQYRGLTRMSDMHFDKWMVSDFTLSPNGKFLGYKVSRFYETYHPERADDYNAVAVYDVEQDVERKSSLDKYASTPSVWPEDAIEDIHKVSDDGVIDYVTRDGKRHQRDLGRRERGERDD